MSKLFSFPRASGAAVAAAIALALSACSSSPGAPASAASSTSASASASASGGVYTLPLNPPDGNIDPLTTADYNAMFIVGLASAGLIEESTTGKLVPQLATSWTQAANKLSWTVNLRQGTKFSTGKPLTANDVVSTFDSILSASSQSPAKSSFTGIVKSVAASPDETSVIFTLDQPYSDFPYLLTGANTWILPAGFKDTNWINDPVGAGQFILEKYTPGQGVTYKKNPYYWDAAAVKVSGVNAKFFNDDQSEVLAFQSGEIDQITSDPSIKSALGNSDRQQRAGYTKFGRGDLYRD